MIPIVAYCPKWSYLPGETVECKVSSILEGPYSARLVRIISADPNPKGPGIIEEDLSQIFSGEYPSRLQKVQLGSYATIPIQNKFPSASNYAVIARIWPTLPQDGEQTIIKLVGQSPDQSLQMYIDRGHFGVRARTSGVEPLEVNIENPTRERVWYSVCVIVSQAAGQIHVIQTRVGQSLLEDLSNQIVGECDFLLPMDNINHVYIGASGSHATTGFYNGKIERPVILSNDVGDADENNPAVISEWDFSKEMKTMRVVDAGPFKNDGELVNCPTRAMCGSNWTGEEMCWRHAPEQYGAIHFHDDDIYDCKWETDFGVKLPKDLPSGMYSVRLERDDAWEDIPFYVRPPAGKSGGKICVIVPTFTYTVYANQARGNADEDYFKQIEERGCRPWNPDQYQQFGLSTYNAHRDGSGIAYSSNLRPNLAMRPKYIPMSEPYIESGMRHLCADTHLYSWLHHLGESFDMVTDDDVHAEGYDILKPYRVVLTTTHPEYHTRNTLDAIERYVNRGGKLMYMGGNGFYWKVAVSDELPGVVEIRRGEGGIRAWAAEPGEYYNALDGEYGGMWRRNGRPPQLLAGVGFTAQGRFQGTYYRKNPDLGKHCEWVFEGVDDEILGDFGLSGGGAAGFELDRVEFRLGTPENTVVLASSEKVPDHFVLVPEEKLTHLATWTGESEEKLIRADMVYFDLPGGGAVFSTGSISYCGSLPWNNFDNNISRITRNVLRRFLESNES